MPAILLEEEGEGVNITLPDFWSFVRFRREFPGALPVAPLCWHVPARRDVKRLGVWVDGEETRAAFERQRRREEIAAREWESLEHGEDGQIQTCSAAADLSRVRRPALQADRRCGDLPAPSGSSYQTDLGL